jgi:hypothetical protein
MKLGGRVITAALPAISHIGTATHKQTLHTGRLYPPGDKLKVKGCVWGLFGTAACRPIVPLPH